MTEHPDQESPLLRAIRSVPESNPFSGIDLSAFRPAPLELLNIAEANFASEFYAYLMERITIFDTSLDNEHEVGLRLVSFGQSIVIHLRAVGYRNPSLIIFIGQTDDNNPVEVVQHVTQISLLLMKLPRKETSEPKPPIGFASESKEHNTK